MPVASNNKYSPYRLELLRVFQRFIDERDAREPSARENWYITAQCRAITVLGKLPVLWGPTWL